MIYLILFIVASQVVQVIFYQKILLSVKRRHKILDAHIRNLRQWTVSNHQAIITQLEYLTKAVKAPSTGYAKSEAPAVVEKPVAQSPMPVFFEPIDQDANEKMKQEDTYLYYFSLLQELQQLNKNLSNSLQSSSFHSSPLNHSLHKKLNGIDRINKPS